MLAWLDSEPPSIPARVAPLPEFYDVEIFKSRKWHY